MKPFAAVGRATIEFGGRWIRIAAIAAGAVSLALWPLAWRNSARSAFMRQVLVSGVEAVPFLGVIACLIGTTAVLQIQLWIATLGQSQFLGPILVAVVVRELGPLIVNLVIIGRGANATAAEIAGMIAKGKIGDAPSAELDPMTDFIMPRAAAWTVSALCLTVYFLFVCFSSGYVFAFLFDIRTGTPAEFADGLLRAVSTADVFSVAAKTTIPPILSAALCSERGLTIGNSPVDISGATTRTVEYAVLTLLTVNTLISVATYI